MFNQFTPKLKPYTKGDFLQYVLRFKPHYKYVNILTESYKQVREPLNIT